MTMDLGSRHLCFGEIDTAASSNKQTGLEKGSFNKNLFKEEGTHFIETLLAITYLVHEVLYL